MPTYEYVCGKCGHEFEAVHSILSPALKVCPKDVCPRKKWGKGKVTRKISAGSGLIFKGDGFYITDHRSDNYQKAAKTDSFKDVVTKPVEAAPKTEPKAAPAKPTPK
jgi:putative FmdB family regulatory protein